MLSFKSKYSNLESVLKDKNYCKWLITNQWFAYKPEYEKVLNKAYPFQKIKKYIYYSHFELSNSDKHILDCSEILDIFEYDFCGYMKSWNLNLPHYIQIREMEFPAKQFFKFKLSNKIKLKELVKEAFKPSRVEYQLLLDPNYKE